MGKTGLHILNCVVWGILLLLFAAVVAVQIPSVQKRLADRFIVKFEDIFKGKASIGDINVQADGTVVIKDILIMDSEPYVEDKFGTGFQPRDTFFYAAGISATVDLRTIFGKSGIHLRRARVDGGVFHLVTEPDGEESITNLQRIFGLEKAEKDFEKGPKTGGPDVFSIRNVRIDNFNFTLENFNDSRQNYPGFGFNYSDLDLVTNIRAHNLKFAQSIMSGVVDELDVREKSGYTASHISGECRVGSGKVLVEDFNLIDPWSDLKLKSFSMSFRNSSVFADFLNRVTLEARFKPSTLAIRSIAYLGTGTLKNNDGVYEISKGHVKGPVCDMLIDGFRFYDRFSGTDGIINARIYGLPDIKEFGIDANVNYMHFSSAQLSHFVSSWANGNRIDMTSIAPGTMFTLNARASGLLNELAVTGTLASKHGSIGLNCHFDELIDNSKPIGLVCRAETGNLDAGALFNVKGLGEAAFDAGVGMTLGKGGTEINLNSLNIRKAVYNDFEFKDITADGSFIDGILKARLSSADTNLVMDISTDLDLKLKDGGRFRIDAGIDNVNLKSFNITKDEEPVFASASLKLDVISDSLMYLNGSAEIKDIRLSQNGVTSDFGDLLVSMDSERGIQNMNLSSKLFEASLTGDKEVTALVNDLLNTTARRELSAICPPKDNPGKPGNYNFSLTVLDNGEMVEKYFPDIYVEKGTRLDASISSEGAFKSRISSGRIAKGLNYLKDVCIDIDNSGDKLNARINGSDLKIGSVPMLSPSVNASADDNSIDMRLAFNGGMRESDYADLRFRADLQREAGDSVSVTIHHNNSDLNFAEEKWSISPSEIYFKGKGMSVSAMKIACGSQSLEMGGGVNLPGRDTLRVVMNDLDLSIVDKLTGKNLGLEGNASGKAYLVKNIDQALGMLLNFKINDFKIGDAATGVVKLASNWDEDDRIIRMEMRNTIDGRDVISATGYFSPQDRAIHAEAVLNDYSLGVIAPLMNKTFSETGGRVSGLFIADGPMKSLKISSRNARFNNALIKLSFTGVPYILDGPFEIVDDKVHLENISVLDDSGGMARISGDLAYNDFKDMSLDASMNFSKLKLIDIEEGVNSPFYGLIKATGNARVYGPLSSLTVDAQVSTDDKGNIHVPLSGSLSSSSGELLTFVNHKEEDPYELMISRKEQKPQGKSDIHVKTHLRVNEGLEAFMEIDKSIGNVISFAGNGQVNLDIRPSKALFNLNGDYSISSGKYHFVLPGVLEKDLNIKQGSSIKMGGDLMDSQIDITATYNVKTSLGTLIADTTGVATRRNVECGLNISNRLRSPDLSFLINIDDLDPTTKNAVEAALNTEDKVQKQFVALLLLGSFIPSESSGVFNGTNMIYSNLSEIVSNQFNSILNKLDIPLDFGFSYQSGMQGKNMFDVAISTQLFNDRVSVSGSVGNRQYKPNSTATSDVVGDVDIQIKLDKNGQYRVNLFSHSADSFTNFLDNTQRNGVGFSFQKDFKARKKEENGERIIIKENE